MEGASPFVCSDVSDFSIHKILLIDPQNLEQTIRVASALSETKPGDLLTQLPLPSCWYQLLNIVLVSHCIVSFYDLNKKYRKDCVPSVPSLRPTILREYQFCAITLAKLSLQELVWECISVAKKASKHIRNQGQPFGWSVNSMRLLWKDLSLEAQLEHAQN